MIVVRLALPADFAAWRAAARALLVRGVPPEQVAWVVEGDSSLFAPAEPDAYATSDAARARASEDRAERPLAVAAPPRVPEAFVDLAATAIAHSDPQRHGVLYRTLWRLARGEPKLLRHITDPDVATLLAHAKAVRRDAHKMKAFVRFVEIDDGASRGGVAADPLYLAWFEPEHHPVDLVAPFFVRRFAAMRFAIVTPHRSMQWDGAALSFGAGAAKPDAFAGSADDMARVWQTYYASIFNPARLNLRMMRQEMPQKYWKNLPEARLIPALVAQAGNAVEAMARRAPTAAKKRVPAPPKPVVEAVPAGSIAALRAAARDCTACPLWQPATQTVFGEGPDEARVFVLGEQPGDQEDLAGRPFVGPAGKLFDRALAEAGIVREALYVTNAVKHFKFEPRGKLRLHARANAAEQAACRRWLTAELAAIAPRWILCLGAMAAQAIFGKSFRLVAERGEWRELAPGTQAIATVHPSYLLRVPDARERARAYDAFVADLEKLARAMGRMS